MNPILVEVTKSADKEIQQFVDSYINLSGIVADKFAKDAALVAEIEIEPQSINVELQSQNCHNTSKIVSVFPKIK